MGAVPRRAEEAPALLARSFQCTPAAVIEPRPCAEQHQPFTTEHAMTEEQKQAFILSKGAHGEDEPEHDAVEWAHLKRGKKKEASALPDESIVLVRALISFNDSFP